MVPDSFTHLHVHTEYSMLDGAARVGDVVAAAAADGQPAIGITDHGNMYGVLDFYKAAKDVGIKPIIGTELYQAYDTAPSADDRGMDDSGGETEGGRKAYYHLTALAENNVGYKNLIQLSSKAFLEGYYYKPRLDWELLSQHAEGVIATTGCLGGHVLQELIRPDRSSDENFDAALKKAGRLQDIFGRDNLFVELQDHGIAEQIRTNPLLMEIARKIGAPLVATNDSHYTHRHDAEAHDALLCVQTGSLRSDADRFKFHGDDHYLKSALGDARPVPRGRVRLRQHPVDRRAVQRGDRVRQAAAARLPAARGLRRPTPRYLARHLTPCEGAVQAPLGPRACPTRTVVERLAYELEVIDDMGFSLVLPDHLGPHQARPRRRHPGGPRPRLGRRVRRGLHLRITDLDPIKYDLLFERFLNPSRISMPDIDMDFDSRYRDEMIRYAAERYGRDHVAQIVTFSTIKARAAVQDASRVLGYDVRGGLTSMAKAMPPLIMGRDTPLRACLELEPKFEDGYKMAAELRQMYETDPDARRVMDVAKGLEGLRRQDGIHAAAVVITKDKLTEYLPIQRKPGPNQDPAEAPVVTQYEMGGVESLGLLKMDFLGLRNLDVISDALEIIRSFRGIELDIDNVPLDDELTYEMLRRGDSMGVFQLEGGPMRALMRSLAPTGFEDVAALVALYRPGPMAANMHNDYADRKNGRKEVTYLHDDLIPVLGDTYGLMIYQESVMRVAQRVAGFSLAEADNLRKACGKKNRELIAKERIKFVQGCETEGYGAEIGTKLFDIIEPFADYAFNKSHAYGYGLIAYQTAYLKAHHPVEYLAALLTSVKTNLDKAAVYLNECRMMKIPVLVPDVNRSASDFVPATIDGVDSIPFGLSAVRNVGSALVDQLVADRDANGTYADFYDFCDRVPLPVLNKKTLEALIKAGAFDSMGHPRRGLLTVYEGIVDQTISRRKEADMGVFTLFGELEDDAGGFNDRPAIPDLDFEKADKLRYEKEMLGLYVSDHPLMGAEAALRRRTDCSIADLAEVDEGALKIVGGVITGLQRKWTKKGDLMAVFTLEDLQGTIEVMVFPNTMRDVGHKLADDAVVCVKARVDKRDDQPKLIAMEVDLFEPVLDGAPPLRLKIPVNGLTDTLVEEIRGLLQRFPGESQVFLHLGERQVLRLPDAWCVDASSGLIAELRRVLGRAAIL